MLAIQKNSGCYSSLFPLPSSLLAFKRGSFQNATPIRPYADTPIHCPQAPPGSFFLSHFHDEIECGEANGFRLPYFKKQIWTEQRIGLVSGFSRKV
jgi:hypothetical protein